MSVEEDNLTDEQIGCGGAGSVYQEKRPGQEVGSGTCKETLGVEEDTLNPQTSHIFFDISMEVSHSSNVKDVVFDSILCRTYLGLVEPTQEVCDRASPSPHTPRALERVSTWPFWLSRVYEIENSEHQKEVTCRM